MPRARNKADLLKFAAENYAKMTELISRMTETQLNTPFDFLGEPSKKEAHWSRDTHCELAQQCGARCADSPLRMAQPDDCLCRKQRGKRQKRKIRRRVFAARILVENLRRDECRVLEKAPDHEP